MNDIKEQKMHANAQRETESIFYGNWIRYAFLINLIKLFIEKFEIFPSLKNLKAFINENVSNN